MTRQELPSFLDDRISQIPALQLLQNLGWQYVTPAEAVKLRSRKLSNVLLEEVLVEQLRTLNRIQFKGQEYRFSEANIQRAVQALKDVAFDGLALRGRFVSPWWFKLFALFRSALIDSSRLVIAAIQNPAACQGRPMEPVFCQ
jgi:hypothetical protein